MQERICKRLQCCLIKSTCRALSDHDEVIEPEFALTIMVCYNLVGNLGKCISHHDVPPVQESMHDRDAMLSHKEYMQSFV